MTVEVAIPADAPVMAAWKAFRETEGYANAAKWLLKGSPTGGEGELWRAFYEGFFSCALANAEKASPTTLDREAVARQIEAVLFRHALDKRLDGYMLETSLEIAALIPTPPEAVAELVAAAENAKLILNDYVADAEDSTVAQAIDRLAKAIRAVKGETA